MHNTILETPFRVRNIFAKSSCNRCFSLPLRPGNDTFSSATAMDSKKQVPEKRATLIVNEMK
jgi:hypothetical protein